MIVFLMTAMLLAQDAGAQSGRPHASVKADAVDVGTIVQGSPLAADFVLHNDGDGPLRIEGAELTGDLRLDRTPAVVAPGASLTLHVTADSSRINGAFNEELRLRLNDPASATMALKVRGEVVPPIQVLPRPFVVLAAARNGRVDGFVDIVNHSTEPIAPGSIDGVPEHIETDITPVEPGRRYRLRLTLDGRGPAGKHMDSLVIHTGSAATPVVRVLLATVVRDRVYAFPDDIDLGVLPLAEWRKGNATLAQTLMVYQMGGTDFEASFSTDVPGLRIEAARGPKKDRWQATITMSPDLATVGAIRGHITVRTNDPGVPTLTVPVSGAVLPDTQEMPFRPQ